MDLAPSCLYLLLFFFFFSTPITLSHVRKSFIYLLDLTHKSLIRSHPYPLVTWRVVSLSLPSRKSVSQYTVKVQSSLVASPVWWCGEPWYSRWPALSTSILSCLSSSFQYFPPLLFPSPSLSLSTAPRLSEWVSEAIECNPSSHLKFVRINIFS